MVLDDEPEDDAPKEGEEEVDPENPEKENLKVKPV